MKYLPNKKNIDLTPIDIWIKAETTMSQNKVTVGINELQTKFIKSIRTKLVVYFSLLFAIVLGCVELADIMGVPYTAFKGTL